jgi:hypothetical protein
MVSAQYKIVRAGSHDSRWYSADTIMWWEARRITYIQQLI